IMVQQAPAGMSVRVHSLLFVPASQWAWMKAQSINGGMIRYRRYRPTRVSRVFGSDENKFLRNQPRAPTSEAGGGWSGSETCWPEAVISATAHLSTRTICLLYQFMNAEISRLMTR